jgi:type IV pilus assembly protein PilN
MSHNQNNDIMKPTDYIEWDNLKNIPFFLCQVVEDKENKDIASLRTEIEALKARQAAVEDLQSDRNTPVHLMGELVAQIPDGVYLQSVKQEGRTVQLTGTAQSQERVSELLRNFSSKSQFLNQPELVEIVSNVQALGNKEQRRVATFTMRVQLTKTQTDTK